MAEFPKIQITMSPELRRAFRDVRRSQECLLKILADTEVRLRRMEEAFRGKPWLRDVLDEAEREVAQLPEWMRRKKE
jgi:hypothetical protein